MPRYDIDYNFTFPNHTTPMTAKLKDTITITLTENQFREIANACEYLGRHLINQPNFKALVLEDWIDDKVKIESAHTLLDIWWAYEYI